MKRLNNFLIFPELSILLDSKRKSKDVVARETTYVYRFPTERANIPLHTFAVSPLDRANIVDNIYNKFI